MEGYRVKVRVCCGDGECRVGMMERKRARSRQCSYGSCRAPGFWIEDTVSQDRFQMTVRVFEHQTIPFSSGFIRSFSGILHSYVPLARCYSELTSPVISEQHHNESILDTNLLPPQYSIAALKENHTSSDWTVTLHTTPTISNSQQSSQWYVLPSSIATHPWPGIAAFPVSSAHHASRTIEENVAERRCCTIDERAVFRE